MDWLTLVFVGLMLGTAFILTLTVRYKILRNVERRRERQHQVDEAARRQIALRGNTRSVTRR